MSTLQSQHQNLLPSSTGTTFLTSDERHSELQTPVHRLQSTPRQNAGLLEACTDPQLDSIPVLRLDELLLTRLKVMLTTQRSNPEYQAVAC